MKKISVTIATNNGFKDVEGYKVDVVYKGLPYEIAVHRQFNDHTRWQLTDLNTGFSVAVLFKTRKDAVDCITVGIMEAIVREMNKDYYKIAQKAMTDYKQLRDSKANR